MKEKHKLQEFLSSVVKYHGHIEEDRKEIENNVKKMMELFENNTKDVSDRSDFLSLGNDIKKILHDLYGQHDRLVGKIKNKVHHREGKSSSGSSDSGSENSSDEDGQNKVQKQKIVKHLSLDDNQFGREQNDSLSKKNAELEALTMTLHAKLEETQHQAGELEGELQAVRNHLRSLDAENSFLKEEVEKSKEQEGKLHLRLTVLQEENEVLMSEKEKISSVQLQTDNSITELKNELESVMGDSRKLKEDNSFLNKELEKNTRDLVHLKQQITLTGEEHETLKTEIRELRSVRDSLTLENASLLFENQDLKALEETSMQQVSNLKGKLLIVGDENNALKEVLTLSTGMHDSNKTIKDMIFESELLKQDISSLHAIVNDLNCPWEEKDDENNVMAMESSESRNVIQQAEKVIRIMSGEAERLKGENSVLSAGHVNLKLELEGKNREIMDLKQHLETRELEVKLLREENSLLFTEQENLKLEFEGNNQKLSKLKEDLEATEIERNSLVEEKSDILSKINESGMVIFSLKSNVLELENEKSQLQLNISNLEVEVQSVNLQLTEVKNKLVEMEHERNSLIEEKSVLLNKVNEDGTAIVGLKAQLEDLQNIKSQLGQEINNLELKIQSANLQLNDVKNALVESESEGSSLTEEKTALLIKINEDEMAVHAFRAQIEELESENSQLQLKISNLAHEIKSAKLQLSDVKNALTETEHDRNALVEEKSALLSKINEDGTAINALKSQVEELESEKSQLCQKISKLDQEIQSVNLLNTDVKNAFVASEEEKKALASESSIIKSKLQDAEFMKGKLQDELREVNQKNTILLGKIEEAEKAKNDFKFEKERLIDDNVHLKIKVKELMTELETTKVLLNHHLEKLIPAAEKEKANFISEIAMLTDKLEQAEAVNENLTKELGLLREENAASQQNLEEFQSKLVDHSRMLETTSSEMQDLRSRLELAQKDVSHAIRAWIDSSKADLEEIYTEKGDLAQELKKVAGLALNNEVSLKRLEDRLKCKSSDQEALMQKFEELLAEHKWMEDRYSESARKLETAEKKIEQLELKEGIIQRLERICEEQKKDIANMGVNYKELLEKVSSTEAVRLDAEREIQRLEVQIRLSNQKLKITETEYREKEENWKRLVEGLKEEHRILSSQLLLWSRISAELNHECKQIKVVFETSIRTLSNDIQELESTSLEIMKSARKQLAECLLELHKLRAKVETELHEKNKLKNENHELAVGVTDKEGIILKLKNDARRNLAKLADMENELKILRKRVAESEKNLQEKKREILDKDEEKREAIRQLCLQIEYHWENHNHLIRHLSLARQNRGTS